MFTDSNILRGCIPAPSLIWKCSISKTLIPFSSRSAVLWRKTDYKKMCKQKITDLRNCVKSEQRLEYSWVSLSHNHTISALYITLKGITLCHTYFVFFFRSYSPPSSMCDIIQYFIPWHCWIAVLKSILECALVPYDCMLFALQISMVICTAFESKSRIENNIGIVKFEGHNGTLGLLVWFRGLHGTDFSVPCPPYPLPRDFPAGLFADIPPDLIQLLLTLQQC